ncbi:MAG: response regulator transcription factor [Rubrivivax sp.]|nr:response regulator transcription factor [Rubrivivax sp.]
MQNRFVVDLCVDGIDGRRMALAGEHDLILLDVRLRGVDGFAILSELRQRMSTPVIMLSDSDGVQDRVRGLRAGADDFLSKPFAVAELRARLQAVLRRSGLDGLLEPDIVRLGELAPGTLKHRASRSGMALELSAHEYKLLSVLLRHRGEVMTRSALTELVWDTRFDGDSNVVEVAIRRLRAKLDDRFATKLLHTVRGMG